VFDDSRVLVTQCCRDIGDTPAIAERLWKVFVEPRRRAPQSNTAGADQPNDPLKGSTRQ